MKGMNDRGELDETDEDGSRSAGASKQTPFATGRGKDEEETLRAVKGPWNLGKVGVRCQRVDVSELGVGKRRGHCLASAALQRNAVVAVCDRYLHSQGGPQHSDVACTFCSCTEYYFVTDAAGTPASTQPSGLRALGFRSKFSPSASLSHGR